MATVCLIKAINEGKFDGTLECVAVGLEVGNKEETVEGLELAVGAIVGSVVGTLVGFGLFVEIFVGALVGS